jgi:uncharacterized protein
MNIILKALVGSHLYGLDTEDSDEDYCGIFVRPLKELLGFGNEEETYVYKNPDTTYHEIKKFMRLAAKGNPTLLEILFCPFSHYSISSYEGDLLIMNRESFLSNHVRDAFGGYSYQQAMKLQNRTKNGMIGFSPRTSKRTEKHARHCFRLLRQGRELMETGTLNPVVKDKDELFEIGKLPVDKIIERFTEEYADYKNVKSILPDEPDWNRLNQILLEIRGV